MQRDCSELLLVWVSCTRLFQMRSSCCFRKWKQRKGPLCLQACLCLLVCACARSIFTTYASPLPVNHPALGSQSRERRSGFQGKVLDQNVWFFSVFFPKIKGVPSRRSHCKVRREAVDLVSTLHLQQHKQVHSHICFINLRLHLVVWPLGWVHSPHSAFVSSLPLKGTFFFLPLAVIWKGVVRMMAVFCSSRAALRCQEMSSPNRCVSLRMCDKVYSRQFKKKKEKKCCFDEKGDYHWGGGEWITGRIYIDKTRMKKTTTLHCVSWAKNVVEDDVVWLITVELPSPSLSISLLAHQ